MLLFIGSWYCAENKQINYKFIPTDLSRGRPLIREKIPILTQLAWSIKDLLYSKRALKKMIFVSCLFPTTEKETSYMLKWWRMPLYPYWINAEYNHLIGYISNSNFQIQNRFHAFISLCVFTFVFCRFLLQKVFFKLINIFMFFVFILVGAFGFPVFWFLAREYKEVLSCFWRNHKKP